MKNKKLAMLTALSILALSMIGFTYALWSDTLTISGSVATGEVHWRLAPFYGYVDEPGDIDWLADCSWYMWKSGKDVGGPTTMTPIDTDSDGDDDTLLITLQNVYPGYYENLAFHIDFLGTVPIIIDNVVIEGEEFRTAPGTVFFDLSGDGQNDIKIRWGNAIGSQFHPGDFQEVSFDILVLQPAPQGVALTFDITLTAVQYNEYAGP